MISDLFPLVHLGGITISKYDYIPTQKQAMQLIYDSLRDEQLKRQIRINFAWILNVKDFGAVGDGITDDTFNISKSISIAANAIGFTIYSADGREVTKNKDGINTITVSNEETKLCLKAAKKVLGYLGR